MLRVGRIEYRNEVRTTVQNCWKSLCNEIEGMKEAARIDKILSKNPGVILGSVKKSDSMNRL